MIKKKKFVFKWADCGFKSSTENGLRIHQGKKHAAKPSCDICAKKFETYREMKIHRYTHSYKGTPFAQEQVCQNCQFKCKIVESMEVHLGKCGSEPFECGLCETTFDKLEMLEIHLNTCEIFECSICAERFRDLSDMKKHMQKHHKSSKNIYHLKIDREDPNEVNVKRYSPSQL